MTLRQDRLLRARAAMTEQGFVGLMIMNHDDLRWFFGRDWAQPRAIIPWRGPPVFIAFQAEEPRLRELYGESEVKIFSHVGEQIQDVVSRFRELVMTIGLPPGAEAPKVGMQMWFHTPAFLVDIFRKVNPMVKLVSSDPVMDPLRAIKEPEELEAMTEAQRLAGLGMDRVRELLRPGVTAHELATEAQYTMMRAGASGTSTPIHVNVGVDTCMIHGRISEAPVREGDPVVVDLTPTFRGYCANLARTFVVGEPSDELSRLLETYPRMIAAVREAMCPGACTRALDAAAREVCIEAGLEDSHIDGISHGIGLRFEERPASTIIRQHRSVPLEAGMTLTIGHTILALPGIAGVRHEDVYRLTEDGPQPLSSYPVEPHVGLEES